MTEESKSPLTSPDPTSKFLSSYFKEKRGKSKDLCEDYEFHELVPYEDRGELHIFKSKCRRKLMVGILLEGKELDVLELANIQSFLSKKYGENIESILFAFLTFKMKIIFYEFSALKSLWTKTT